MRTGTGTAQMSSVRRTARGLQEYIRDELGSYGLDSSDEDERISELYLLRQGRAQLREAFVGVDDAVLREGYLAELQTFFGRTGASTQIRNQPRNPAQRLETTNTSRGGQTRDSIAEEEELSYYFPGISQDAQSPLSRNQFHFDLDEYLEAAALRAGAGEVGGKKPKNVVPAKKKEQKVEQEQEELPSTFRWVQIEIVDEEKIPDCKKAEVKPWLDDD